MLVFNEDTNVSYKQIDLKEEPKPEIESKRTTGVLLHHISAVDVSFTEEILDLAIDFIWKMTLCASIRIQLHHYPQPDPKNEGQMRLKGNLMLRQMLKQRCFRWKTLKNESNGSRIEILELLNSALLQTQDSKNNAFIFRRGLNQNDTIKENFNIKVRNSLIFAPKTSI